MKAIEIAFIFWFVLGSHVQAHRIHKRILVNPQLSHTDASTTGNETVSTTSTSIPEDIPKNDPIDVSNITEHATDVVVPPPIPIDVNLTSPQLHVPITNDQSILISLKPSPELATTETTNKEPLSKDVGPEPLARPQNQTYLLSVVIVPSIIPNDNDPHVEKPSEVEVNESPTSPTDTKIQPKPCESFNTNLSKPIMGHTNDPIDISIDFTRFINPKTGFTRENKKFENATTSMMSEFESEMGLLFEIVAGAEPKHNVSLSSTANDSSLGKTENDSLSALSLVGSTNKSENLKFPIDDVPFFEDFSPFFPLESFFGSILMPQETIIIETDSGEISNPGNFFPIFPVPHEILMVPNNTQPIKKEDLAGGTPTLAAATAISTTPQNSKK